MWRGTFVESHMVRVTTCRALMFVLLAAVASTAEAQQVARSFAQLQVLVTVGDTVTVTDVRGQDVPGRITELTSSSLALVAGDSQHPFLEPEAARVRQRRSDGLGNGALWGLVVGGA